MINFSELPKESPNALPAPDIYKAKIVKAEMKDPSATAKSQIPYLNMQYQLTDIEGKSVGNIYDMQFDSDNSVLQYKLGRFLTACAIPLTGAMELKDIAKIVLNKEIVVDVKNTVDKEGKYAPKAEVNTFDREIYYPVSEFRAIYDIFHGNATTAPAADTFINAGVSDDGSVTNTGSTY